MSLQDAGGTTSPWWGPLRHSKLLAQFCDLRIKNCLQLRIFFTDETSSLLAERVLARIIYRQPNLHLLPKHPPVSLTPSKD